MRVLRSVCFTLNIVLLIVACVILTDDFDKLNEFHEWFVAVVVAITPLLSAYYFMNADDSEAKDDSLLGLWVKVKKKKLKDQLSPNDD
jgi:heme/copper-type cytochrome/quinol oxidase subunit 4